jgi:hypothetical protein
VEGKFCEVRIAEAGTTETERGTKQ